MQPSSRHDDMCFSLAPGFAKCCAVRRQPATLLYFVPIQRFRRGTPVLGEVNHQALGQKSFHVPGKRRQTCFFRDQGQVRRLQQSRCFLEHFWICQCDQGRLQCNRRPIQAQIRGNYARKSFDRRRLRFAFSPPRHDHLRHAVTGREISAATQWVLYFRAAKRHRSLHARLVACGTMLPALCWFIRASLAQR